MSKASINTGDIDFQLQEKSSDNTQRESDTPMHIAILADFSARGSRENSTPALEKRKLIEINRDNFDDVFERLDVQLKLPVSDESLCFSELDELNPDFIYERINLFDKLRVLSRKLKKKESFAAAAEEIQAWSSYRVNNPEPTPEQDIPEGIPMPDNLLDAALTGHDISSRLDQGPLGNIDNMIKDIVSPFMESKADPRQSDMLNAVDEATSSTMRSIMHHSAFQQLEASWRALYWLIRQIETDGNIKFYVLDVTQQEAREDLALSASDSFLYKTLVESRQTAQGTPFAMIVGDYQLQASEQDAELASQMAALAHAGGGCWISGGHENLAGAVDISKEVDPDHWQHSLSEAVNERWQQLRSLGYSANLALAAPRFMLRLPYGKKTTPTDNFEYEELQTNGAHSFYLWGNSAYLLAALLAQGYSRESWQAMPGRVNEAEGLPLHVYNDEDGDSTIKPCAEVLLTDRAAARFTEAGLLPVRSVQNSDNVRVPKFTAVNGDNLQGLW